MKIQNLVYTKSYEANGEIKKQYIPCGRLITFDDGGQQVVIDSIPTEFNGKLNVYSQKKKEAHHGDYEQ